MLRRLYDWTISLAQSPHALWALAIVSFIESSFFPIPPDVLMIPMIIARPSRAFLIAGIATIASVAGALLGYYIGAALMETIGQPIFDFYGKTESVAEMSAVFNAYGAWAVVVAGVTFLPFKVVTILSGATGLPLGVFIVSSIFARALRFFLVAALLWKFGAPIRDFIEKRLGLMFALFCVLLIGGFAMIGLL
ncbi:YqaA family protein [Yoonia sp.]|uniref:YqaA family protein n=1 Tax=Yoonia sp. TaxID=2212373 RepID=UPI00358E9FA4